jgi:hypothetical protein
MRQLMNKKAKELDAQIEAEMKKMYPPSHEFLFKLKTELAVRHDNEHVGTGMGGNPSQLYYFMTHDVMTKHSPDENVHVSQEGNTAVFALPAKAKQVEIRKAFNKFWETCSDKNSITQEQLQNPSFLRDQNTSAIEVHLLIQGLETAYELISWLDREAEFDSQVSSFFAKEREATEEGFLKDMKLPLDYFKKIEAAREQARKENRSYHVKDPMRRVLSKHPVWGKRSDAISKRRSQITDLLLSQEDTDKLNTIGALPSHLVMFVIRSVVHIERLVKHNLDEKISFLNDINKEVENSEEE